MGELRIRWLGRVNYHDAHALQRGLWATGRDDWLLLLEHPHVYTLGARADTSHVLVPPADLGAELISADRGGDVTYHGPGQLVAYPIRSTQQRSKAYVHDVEQLVIDTLGALGLQGASRLEGYPGVWVGADSPTPRKIAAIGVRLSRGRSMHGLALNVDPDLSMFDHIVPCGIEGKAVTSLTAEGIHTSMREVVDVMSRLAAQRWAPTGHERADVVWRHSPEDLAPFSRGETVDDGSVTVELTTTPRRRARLTEAGVGEGMAVAQRKPEWLRAPLEMGDDYMALRKRMRSLDLVTVCEEAGCPNIYECWSDGTATFMINGERCTRACGFCQVDTRLPLPPADDEPQRVAEAVKQMGLRFAVVTAVARDDLPDGGAGQFAETIRAVRSVNPGASVEVLIPDCKGDSQSLETIFDARPDVLNHNIETTARLQRAVRPSASYARSLAVLARASQAGLVTKSGLIVGMGESDDEVIATLADLAGVGTDIVTIGQYLRPSAAHLPVVRWVPPEQYEVYKSAGEALGIPHVEASPLTRSSYHAREAAEAAEPHLVAR